MLPAVILPVTARLDNVPTLVMLGCAAVVTVPAVVAVVALDTVPVTFAPAISLSPEPLPVNTPVFAVNATAVTVPFTPSEVNVPTEVMFGCAFVVTVPAVPAVAAFKFATCVVEETTNGAVPVAMFDIN